MEAESVVILAIRAQVVAQVIVGVESVVILVIRA